MKQDQETLGRYLKREREMRHVTVEEIALFIGVDRSLAHALEADDCECFPEKADGLRLVRQYTAYLNLDRTEAVRRFEGQWKMSAGLKRYPKLTHCTDASPRKRGVFGGKRPFAGVSPAKMAVVSALGVLLLVIPFLVSHLPDLRTLFVPPAPVSQEPAPAPQEPASGIVKKAAPPPGEYPAPASASGAVKASAPRRAPAIDPLYTPPGRVREKPVPPAAAKPAPLPTRGRVVGNRDSKRYHLPGMKYYDSVKAYHRVIFQSEREALRAGYVKARE